MFNGDISCVGCSHKAGLREGVLQGEELIFGHGHRPRLENGPGSDGGQILALVVSEGNVAAMVFHGKVTFLEIRFFFNWNGSEKNQIMSDYIAVDLISEEASSILSFL